MPGDAPRCRGWRDRWNQWNGWNQRWGNIGQGGQGSIDHGIDVLCWATLSAWQESAKNGRQRERQDGQDNLLVHVFSCQHKNL